MTLMSKCWCLIQMDIEMLDLLVLSEVTGPA